MSDSKNTFYPTGYKYLYIKNGNYYFRKVKNKKNIIQSLKTRDLNYAKCCIDAIINQEKLQNLRDFIENRKNMFLFEKCFL